jgi:GTP-binding protein
MKAEDLRITEADFAAGAIDVKGLPPPALAEIAFAGRSNAGKSSVMNTLVQRRSLVRTSSTPGCTRQLNVFKVGLKSGHVLGLVDLPGYGFAKLSKKEKSTWGNMIESYIQTRPTLRAVVLIVDVRRGLEHDDLELLDFVLAPRPAEAIAPLRAMVVATKLDKLPRNQQKPRLAALKAAMKARSLGGAPIGFSAVTGDGREELWEKLLRAVDGSAEAAPVHVLPAEPASVQEPA